MIWLSYVKEALAAIGAVTFVAGLVIIYIMMVNCNHIAGVS